MNPQNSNLQFCGFFSVALMIDDVKLLYHYLQMKFK